MTRTTFVLCAVLASSCSVIVEDQIHQLPPTSTPDAGPGTVCQTAQDCLDIDTEANNCQQVCVMGADGRGNCRGGANTPDGVFCGDTMAMDEICIAGTCSPRMCGDGFDDRAAGEYCDDGNDNDTDLCRNNCTRRCVPPATPRCDDVRIDGTTIGLHLDSCSGGEGTCDMTMDRCLPMTALADGTSCVIPRPVMIVDGGVVDGGVGMMGRCQTGRCIPFFP